MSTDSKTKRDTLLREIKIIIETLWHQNVLSQSIYNGIISRLNDIDVNPFALLLELENNDVEVDNAGNKYKLHLTITPID